MTNTVKVESIGQGYYQVKDAGEVPSLKKGDQLSPRELSVLRKMKDIEIKCIP